MNLSLKELQTRKRKLQEKLDREKLELTEISESIKKTKDKIRSIDDNIKRIRRKLVLGEHAILRYLEYHLDIDIETIKENIMTEDLLTKIKTYGNGRYPITSDLKAVVKDNTIVSIISKTRRKT